MSSPNNSSSTRMVINSWLLAFGLIYLSTLAMAKSVAEPEPTNDSKLPGANIRGPFTDHFQEWLEDNKFGVYNFTLTELGAQASFGGKQSDGERVKRRPVLFIHGNSDGALADGPEEWAQGWSASIEHFLDQGYSTAELYAVTYGDRNLANSLKRSHDCDTMIRLRRFVEAILKYTEADKVDIVAHSMGVTLARHIIQGRGLDDLEASEKELDGCYLGPSLRHRVHTLVGIAGANYGLCICANEQLAESAPACSKQTGFWAGSGCADAPQDECHLARPVPDRAHCHSSGKYAKVLHRLNTPERPKDAHFVVSIWSDADAILGPSNFAWGRQTSLIPNSDHSAIYPGHSHYSLKWMTVRDQFGFLAEATSNRSHNRVHKIKVEKAAEKEAKEALEALAI